MPHCSGKYITINTLILFFDMSKQKNKWLQLPKSHTRTSRKRHQAATRSPVSCLEESQRLGNQWHLAASSFSPRPVGRSRLSERATCLIISSKRWPYSNAKSTSNRSISVGKMSRRSYLVTSFLPRVKFTRSWITKIMRLLLCLRAVVSVGSSRWIPLSYLLSKKTFISRLSCISWHPNLSHLLVLFTLRERLLRNYLRH